MTTHELAKKLLEGPNVLVTVSGYEGGVNEVTTVCEVDKLHLNYYDEWYYGKHDYRPYSCDSGCDHKVIDAIHIGA